RPSRASIVPKGVESLLDSAARQNPQIVELEAPLEAAPALSGAPILLADAAPEAPPVEEPLSLTNPEFPAPPAVPQLEPPPAVRSSPPRSSPPRSSPPRERTWMSSRTPAPTLERLGSMRPSAVPLVPATDR